MMINFLGFIGHFFISILDKIGDVLIFGLRAMIRSLKPPYYYKIFVKQVLDIGYFSLPVVALTTLFAGMVLALQSYSGGFQQQLAGAVIPQIVVLGITRELAPVLAGLMVTGRIGAAIAAELGTMRVSEQIDALQALSVDPYRYLIMPRILAGILVLPLLVLVGDVIGVMGGYIVSVHILGINGGEFTVNMLNALHVVGVLSGLVKAAIFGGIITIMGCYQGFYSRGGAEGVGRATTNAVVYASITILIANFLVTMLFVGVQ